MNTLVGLEWVAYDYIIWIKFIWFALETLWAMPFAIDESPIWAFHVLDKDLTKKYDEYLKEMIKPTESNWPLHSVPISRANRKLLILDSRGIPLRAYILFLLSWIASRELIDRWLMTEHPSMFRIDCLGHKKELRVGLKER
jgi:hypothetical protein